MKTINCYDYQVMEKSLEKATTEQANAISYAMAMYMANQSISYEEWKSAMAPAWSQGITTPPLGVSVPC